MCDFLNPGGDDAQRRIITNDEIQILFPLQRLLIPAAECNELYRVLKLTNDVCPVVCPGACCQPALPGAVEREGRRLEVDWSWTADFFGL